VSELKVLFADHVVLGEDAESLRVAPARIQVAGTQITQVVEQARAAFAQWRSPEGAAVMDLGDRLISPAFVNGHTHLAMAAFRGLGSSASFERNVVEDLFFELERGLTSEDVRAFTRLGAFESLLAGVGLVWDHYYAGLAVAEALADTGLAGVVAPTLQDLGGPGRTQWEGQLEATAHIAEDSRLRAAGVHAAVGPHATDTVSNELLERAQRLAEARALPVHLHLAQSYEEYARSRETHGCTPTERLARSGLLSRPPRALLVHALYVTDSDLTRLDPSRVALGYCPQSQARFAFPADPSLWSQAGLPWVLGTDSAPCNDSMNLQKELRAAAGAPLHATTYGADRAQFRASGALEDAQAVATHRAQGWERASEFATPARLLASVWSVPGSMHPALPSGAVAPGCLANLAIWDLGHPAFWPATDPLRSLAYGDTTGAIDWMMVAGRFVGERGRFAASICESGKLGEARREADARLQRHLDRLGIRGARP
jgi:5-methylthioadenosine/S-adenosylhomocysteine deaminase